MSLGPLMASLVIIIFPPPVIVDVNRNKYLEFEFSLVKNVYDEFKKKPLAQETSTSLGPFLMEVAPFRLLVATHVALGCHGCQAMV